jgi:hypothetical protein
MPSQPGPRRARGTRERRVMSAGLAFGGKEAVRWQTTACLHRQTCVPQGWCSQLRPGTSGASWAVHSGEQGSRRKISANLLPARPRRREVRLCSCSIQARRPPGSAAMHLLGCLSGLCTPPQSEHARFSCASHGCCYECRGTGRCAATSASVRPHGRGEAWEPCSAEAP